MLSFECSFASSFALRADSCEAHRYIDPRHGLRQNRRRGEIRKRRSDQSFGFASRVVHDSAYAEKAMRNDVTFHQVLGGLTKISVDEKELKMNEKVRLYPGSAIQLGDFARFQVGHTYCTLSRLWIGEHQSVGQVLRNVFAHA